MTTKSETLMTPARRRELLNLSTIGADVLRDEYERKPGPTAPAATLDAKRRRELLASSALGDDILRAEASV